MEIERTNEEIDALINMAMKNVYQGKSKYPGMSYEEGIRAAIDWLFGDTDEHPMMGVITPPKSKRR